MKILSGPRSFSRRRLNASSPCPAAQSHAQNHFADLLFRQEPTLEELLHTSICINEDTNRQTIDTVQVGNAVVSIHKDRKRMRIVLNMLSNFLDILQFIDRQDHEAR